MSAPKASNNFIAIFIAAFARKHFVQINRPENNSAIFCFLNKTKSEGKGV